MFKHRGKVLGDRQRQGTYTCSSCKHPLFEASKKFEVGSGFPSFWEQIGEHVTHFPLHTYDRQRIQLLCSQCGQHLGHLFQDNRTPSRVRYCINADSLHFEV
jgi:peptide-methionine (R)-S-oxide reductase